HQLTNWLFEHVTGTHFHTSRLIDHYPLAKNISGQVAGLCFLVLDHTSRTGIVWLRGEVQKTIEWAGDPNKAVTVDQVSKAVQPRQSFESWKELVRYQSADWHKAELNAASVICASLQRHMHLADLLQEESKYRTLNGRLKKANDELANMNWISSHDLKEPLRKIQMYASVVLEKQGDQIPETVRSNINRMQVSAARMQLLIDDLLAYSKVVNEEKKFAIIDLNFLLPELHHELGEEIEKNAAVIQWSPSMPLIRGVPFQIRQLLINLISNGLKFSAPGVPPLIRIGCAEVDDRDIRGVSEKNGSLYHKLTVADNGIGFNPAYSENILKIFQRLHSHQYAGTGVGLAICNKIAEAHNGFLEANGEEGKGATFTFYLPVAVEQTPVSSEAGVH
ncbi:MAG: ATP-binding protein, partial [Chitinophagaceae bacterium]